MSPLEANCYCLLMLGKLNACINRYIQEWFVSVGLTHAQYIYNEALSRKTLSAVA